MNLFSGGTLCNFRLSGGLMPCGVLFFLLAIAASLGGCVTPSKSISERLASSGEGLLAVDFVVEGDYNAPLNPGQFSQIYGMHLYVAAIVDQKPASDERAISESRASVQHKSQGTTVSVNYYLKPGEYLLTKIVEEAYFEYFSSPETKTTAFFSTDNQFNLRKTPRVTVKAGETTHIGTFGVRLKTRGGSILSGARVTDAIKFYTPPQKQEQVQAPTDGKAVLPIVFQNVFSGYPDALEVYEKAWTKRPEIQNLPVGDSAEFPPFSMTSAMHASILPRVDEARAASRSMP